MSLDTGHDLFYLASDLHLGAEKLFGFLDCLAGDDLTYLELHFLEVLEGDLLFFRDVDHRLFLFGFLGLAGCGFGCGLLGLYLFQNLFDVLTCEKDLRLVCHLVSGLIETESMHIGKLSLLGVQLSEDLLGSLRHEGAEKAAADRDALYQVVENCCQTILFLRILGQSPGHGLVDVFVAAFEENEDLTDSICHTKVIHLCVYFVHGGENNLFEVLIHGVAHAFVSHNAAEIFI